MSKTSYFGLRLFCDDMMNIIEQCISLLSCTSYLKFQFVAQDLMNTHTKVDNLQKRIHVTYQYICAISIEIHLMKVTM